MPAEEEVGRMSMDDASERPSGVTNFMNRHKVVQRSNSDTCVRGAMSLDIPRNSKFLSGRTDASAGAPSGIGPAKSSLGVKLRKQLSRISLRRMSQGDGEDDVLIPSIPARFCQKQPELKTGGGIEERKEVDVVYPRSEESRANNLIVALIQGA
jgi:hypothetical protein